MNRRGFMAAILASACAPAVVRAASLMPVVARPSGVLTLADLDRVVDLWRQNNAAAKVWTDLLWIDAIGTLNVTASDSPDPSWLLPPDARVVEMRTTILATKAMRVWTAPLGGSLVA